MDTVNVSLAKDNLFKRSVSFWSDRILDAALRKIICTGALTVITSSGQRQDHGDGIGTPVTIRFHSPVWQLAVVLDPELRVGEAYADGHLTVEKNSIADFLYVVVSNYNRASHPLSQRWLHYVRSLLRTLFRHNNQSRSRSNAAPTAFASSPTCRPTRDKDQSGWSSRNCQILRSRAEFRSGR